MMKIFNMILAEAAKISAILSGKVHKFEYLVDKEIFNNKLSLLFLL